VRVSSSGHSSSLEQDSFHRESIYPSGRLLHRAKTGNNSGVCHLVSQKKVAG
jgi:hypothetical protein